MKEFNEIQKNVEFSLAPHNLLALLSLYQLYLERESYEDNDGQLINIEKRIKAEVIKGYRKYERYIHGRSRIEYLTFLDDNVEIHLDKNRNDAA